MDVEKSSRPTMQIHHERRESVASSRPEVDAPPAKHVFECRTILDHMLIPFPPVDVNERSEQRKRSVDSDSLAT